MPISRFSIVRIDKVLHRPGLRRFSVSWTRTRLAIARRQLNLLAGELGLLSENALVVTLWDPSVNNSNSADIHDERCTTDRWMSGYRDEASAIQSPNLGSRVTVAGLGWGSEYFLPPESYHSFHSLNSEQIQRLDPDMHSWVNRDAHSSIGTIAASSVWHLGTQWKDGAGWTQVASKY